MQKKQYGHFCFKNTSPHTLDIYITEANTNPNTPPNTGEKYSENLTVSKGNKTCVHRLDQGVYRYTAHIAEKELPSSPNERTEVYLAGQINIKVCETGEFEIK